MTTLRTIRPWLPLLQRPPRTWSCHGAAATPTFHRPPAVGAACPRQVRPFAVSAARLGGKRDEFGSGRRSGFTVTEEEEEEEDFIADSEVEQLFQQQVPADIGEGQHRVFIVHPDVKWGSRKQHLTTGNTLINPSFS